MSGCCTQQKFHQTVSRRFISAKNALLDSFSSADGRLGASAKSLVHAIQNQEWVFQVKEVA
jgi:hypothetical protein